MRMRGRTTSTATTSRSGPGTSWSQHPATHLLHGPVRRLSSAAIASSSSGATPRRMETTSTTSSSSTFRMPTGRESMQKTSRVCAPTTPASCTRPASTFSEGSMPGPAFRTCTNTASTSACGSRSCLKATRRWAVSATPRWCASQECLYSVAGTAMTLWTTSTSSPWPQSTGTASLAVETSHPRGTVTALRCTVAACSSLVASTSARRASQTSVSSTLTRGRGRA
mmetsp:Transcript_70751/g.163572  ORF Transcript_70751/g.163572 Transcript_70751/m.163572 type:complete len:225 (-) Transcript_70751:524-1198(-)